MKHLCLLFAISLFLVGCDAPQRTRVQTTNSSSFTDPSANTGDLGTTTGSTTGSTTGGTSSGNTTPGFENCDLGNKYHNIDVGHFGICQSSQDETLFKFRTSLASTSSRVCLIPTYKDASGSSTYLGNPQCTLTQADVVIQGKLYKDRTGYTHLPITGVIVMKEGLTPQYFSCMLAYSNWPANACQSSGNIQYCNYWRSQCPYGGGGQTGTPCDTEARKFMNQICTSFKNSYANSYTDIRTK